MDLVTDLTRALARQLAGQAPLADIAPDRSSGGAAVPVILGLVALLVVIGIVVGVLRSRRK